ncbi:putative Heterokaryon incompatibility domain-containing protein [Seiridium cardinale]|uniref:Heterokaryon incompatibility domain-containing protein n=1 Tax=Seiridium cardinale TaxID=138064 RepID=A0ABR2XRN8_9PEZI
MAEVTLLGEVDRGATCQVDVLCTNCQRIGRDSSIIRGKCKDLDAQETYDHYDSIAKLEASATSGCHLCNLLGSAIGPYLSSRPKEASTLAVRVVILVSEEIKKRIADGLLRAYSYFCWEFCIMEVNLTGTDDSSVFTQKLDICRTKYWAFDKHSHGPDDDEWDMLGVNAPDEAQTSLSTLSDNCLNLAKVWLDDCLQKHRSCTSTGSGFLPTRLLDVGHSNSSRTIRLVLSHTLPANTPYFTLSYCWGRGKPLVLTGASLPIFVEEIDVVSLPKTISDSVDITRRLGYRYLWVDSLCIIQDSKEDWKSEAAKMGEVYSNSTLTVAATSSSSNDQGCYKSRNPLSYLPCRLSGSAKNGVYICPEWKSRDLNMIQEKWIQQAPLNTRAWVVQERLLSQRILHFTANGIFWECSSRIANDSCPEGRRVGRTRRVPENIRWHLRGLLAAPSLRQSLNQPVSGAMARMNRMAQRITLGDSEWDQRFMENWRMVVNLFSRCQLTVGTDKKPAIAGIISQICATRGLRYAYGLWYRDQLVPHHLLWMARGVTEPLPPRPAARGASTWSWLSVDGEITYLPQLPPGLEQKDYDDTAEWAPYCTVQLIGQPEAEDDAKGAVLSVKGRAIGVSSPDLAMLNFKPDCALPDPMPEILTVVPLVYKVSSYARMLIFDSTHENEMQQQWHHKGFAGLVLKTLGNGEVYERIGMFSVVPPRPMAMSATDESLSRSQHISLFNRLGQSEEDIFRIV